MKSKDSSPISSCDTGIPRGMIYESLKKLYAVKAVGSVGLP